MKHLRAALLTTRLATVLLLLASAHGEARPGAPASSHLKNFDLHHCARGSCARAQGALAWISLGADSLAAAQVRLEVRRAGKPPARYLCSSFRYDLRSGVMICDNRGEPGSASLVIDGELRVSKS